MKDNAGTSSFDFVLSHPTEASVDAICADFRQFLGARPRPTNGGAGGCRGPPNGVSSVGYAPRLCVGVGFCLYLGII